MLHAPDVVETGCLPDDAGGRAGNPEHRGRRTRGPVLEQQYVRGNLRLYIPKRKAIGAWLETILPGAGATLFDEREYLRRRGSRVRKPKRDQRIVDVAFVGEKLRLQRDGLEIGADGFDGDDGPLVQPPCFIVAALGLGNAAAAVERLPLFFDESGARRACERGFEIDCRFVEPPHAAKGLPPVQKRLNIAYLVGRIVGQLTQRQERVKRYVL